MVCARRFRPSASLNKPDSEELPGSPVRRAVLPSGRRDFGGDASHRASLDTSVVCGLQLVVCMCVCLCVLATPEAAAPPSLTLPF